MWLLFNQRYLVLVLILDFQITLIMSNRELIRELNTLHRLCVRFVGTYLSNPQDNSDYKNTAKALQSLANYITPILKAPEKLPSPDEQEVEETCTIDNIIILGTQQDGYLPTIQFPSTTLQVEIQATGSACDIPNETVALLFSDGDTVNISLSNIKSTDTGATAEFPVDFNGHEMSDNTMPFVKLKVGNTSSDKIYYSENTSINLSTTQDTTSTISYFKWHAEKYYIFIDRPGFSDIREEVKAVFKNLNSEKAEIDGKFYGNYILITKFKRAIEKHPHIQTAEKNDLDALAQEDTIKLMELAKQYKATHKLIKKISTTFDEQTTILSKLEAHYSGPEDAKNRLFNRSYDARIKTSQALLETIQKKEAALLAYINTVDEHLKTSIIPKKLIDQATALIQLKKTQEEEVEYLNATAEGYHDSINDPQYDFETWENAIQIMEAQCNAIQEAWDKAWDAFELALNAFAGTHPAYANSDFYRTWVNETVEPLKDHLDQKKIVEGLAGIRVELEPFKRVFEQTDHDGVLEYSGKTENVGSNEERDMFIHDGIVPDLRFAKIYKRLFDKKNGVEVEDVVQGNTGDCYLMAALISIADGNSQVIHDMISYDKKKKIFTVKLHRDGVPVDVEVDKRLLKYQLEGYEENFAGVEPQDDLWVAIIEKAYAKLMGQTGDDPGGDYSKIVGGNATKALKVLLGNKVSQPDKLFLDRAGNIVEADPAVTLENPIDLSAVNQGNLRQLLISATNLNYEITVSSPDTFDGQGNLTDRDIIYMGNNQYMSCNHAYTLMAADGSGVTIRNPHGNSQRDVTLYDRAIPPLIQALNNAIGPVKQNFDTNDVIPNNLKSDMDLAVAGINRNRNLEDIDLIDQVTAIWERLIRKKFIQNATTQVWELKKSKTGFRKKVETTMNRLDTLVTEINNSPIAQGRVDKNRKITVEQTITYNTLTTYFEEIAINIIQ